jgi:large subunit ribosomal protein L6e
MSGKVSKKDTSYTYLAHGISAKGRSASFRKRAFKVKLGAKGKKVAGAAKPAPVNKVVGRFYGADDVATPLPSRKAQQHRVAALKSGYAPGTVLILLAGRFRGKRVVLLGRTKAGLLLVCGMPFNAASLNCVLS